MQAVLAALLPVGLIEDFGHALVGIASESSPGFSIADVLALGRNIANTLLSPRLSPHNIDCTVFDITRSLASTTLAHDTQQLQLLVASAVAQARPSVLRALTSSSLLPRCEPPVCAGFDKQLSEISILLKSVFNHGSAQVSKHLRRCSGLLLCGPSGCGKSVVARWIAASLATSANFITLEAPAVLSAVVGDSEKALSSAFERARASAPSVLFIDKLEVLGRVRGQDSTTEGTYDRLLATLLVEMDGLRQGMPGSFSDQPVFFLASTENAGAIDGALLRPGRFEHIVALPAPDLQQRAQVFRAVLGTMSYSGDLELDCNLFAQMSDGWSMARISSSCVAAALSALRADPKAANFKAAQVIDEINGA